MKTIAMLVIMPLVCVLFAMACGSSGIMVSGLSLFALCTLLIFIMQWLAFVPSYLLQTERFFDLTGSVTYITAVAILVWYRWPDIDVRALLLASMVAIWAVRLGVFLFSRIHKAGKDDRFDEFKPHFFRFLIVWTMQGVWITFTSAAALAAMILGGMGPVRTISENGAKIFAACYALFSGLIFVAVMGITLAPVTHRMLHKFHLDESDM
jgi:steroid 5-alpha reductase family enzyme